MFPNLYYLFQFLHLYIFNLFHFNQITQIFIHLMPLQIFTNQYLLFTNFFPLLASICCNFLIDNNYRPKIQNFHFCCYFQNYFIHFHFKTRFLNRFTILLYLINLKIPKSDCYIPSSAISYKNQIIFKL